MSFNFSLSNLLLLLALPTLLFWATLIESNNSNSTFIKSWCSETKFNHQTSYKNNLNKLLSSLPAKAGDSTNNGYYATNTSSFGTNNSEPIYALFLCQGDTTPIDCQRCVSNAITKLPPKECSTAKSAIVWYDKCMVRYSNDSFLSTVDEDIKLRWKTDDVDISVTKYDADKSMRLACLSLFDIAFDYSYPRPRLYGEGDRKYYSTRDVPYNNTVGVHTIAQCTPDLTPTDCGKCVRLITDEMSTFCNGSKSVRMFNPNCNTWCQIYRLPLPPDFSPKPVDKGNSRSKRTSLIVAVSISAIISILVCFGVWFHVHNRNAMTTTKVEVSEIKKAVDSLQFNISKIRSATGNFAADNKLGEGGFGEVYKGKLENGQEIAVKRLSKKSEQGVAEFKTEVVLVAKLQHKNLVKLCGFCVAANEKLLVYEYLPNSSLDRFLFDRNKQASLDWKTRFKIIIGIARGLLYLHEDSPRKVIHRDLKSSNILLDENMNPKISDFGLAKLFGVNQTQGDTNRIVGTYGYMAPEYAITGHYSVKSDIYSFGVIVLEIISGERNGFFQEKHLEEALLYRAWRLWNENKALDLVDATLNDDFLVEEVIRSIHVGLLCIQEHAIERPRMTSIVAALSGQSISLPAPKPPHFLGYINDSEDLYTASRTITDLQPRE